ncbi:MAG: DUF4160 domain-containing protein [Propionivibrio sp.]|uniref:DUF4160 domain-containing protein n=1 Tax=Propionivibrio sp. TaxID=2212460 RepID=UPI001A612554|nr:DUF4160 domain-containing protein [Propionivibrio sp.]MBL8415873.1 DUF4160 domain-containing protein [Propionivibrio sp.]
MPTISEFFGIVIQMFWREHAPPHFHALYGEHEALIDIRTLEVMAGKLPRRALALTIEWAAEHRSQLTRLPLFAAIFPIFDELRAHKCLIDRAWE